MRYRDRLRVWESNYGRSQGWDLELDGRPVAFMDEPRGKMFCRLPSDHHDRRSRPRRRARFRILLERGRLVAPGLPHRATGLAADCAFPSGQPFAAPGRVTMCALYIAIGPPMPSTGPYSSSAG